MPGLGSRLTVLCALLLTVTLSPLTAAQATAQDGAPDEVRAVGHHPIPRTVPGLRSTGGSVLGYQCGPAVCLVDPDAPGADPVQVTPDGRFAGVTADGATVAWVPTGGGLVTAPTTGGPTTTVYTGTVGIEPEISPDGTRVLWTSAAPIYIGSFAYYYKYRLDIATGETRGVGACACAATHGFAGTTSIGTYPYSDQRPSSICVIGTTEETGSSSACGPVLVGDPRGALSFPDASADGQTFVAAMDPTNPAFGGYQGRIALYSRAGLVKDLTTNDTDTTPTLSQEGDRVAFERDGTIAIVDVATGAVRAVGPGTYPSWGGRRSGGTSPASATAAVKGSTVRLKKRKAAVRIACAGSGRCTGSATLGKRGKVLAKHGYRVRAGRTGTVKLSLTKAGRAKFRGHGRIRLTLTLRPQSGSKVTKKVTVRY